MKNLLIRKGLYVFMTAILLNSGLSSCWDENEWESIPNGAFLQVAETSLNFDSPATTYQLEVKCNEEYAVGYGNGLENWCTATKDELGDLTLNITENTEKDVRRGELYIKALSQTDTIPVAQLGWGKAILVSVSVLNMSEAGGEFDVDVTANVSYDFDFADCDWIEETTTASSRAYETVTRTHYFVVNPNKGEARNASITVDDVENSEDIGSVTFTVMQKGLGNYEPGTPETSEDIKLEVMDVTGDGGDCRGSRKREYMLDGDPSTSWLSEWQGGIKKPQYLEFSFDKVDMDYIIYSCSSSGDRFKDIKVEVMTDVNKERTPVYKVVFDGELPNVGSSRIDFNASQTGVTKVKFTLEDSWGNENNGFSCNEMEFYKKDPSTFDWTTLFADPACTDLKADISESDILSCTHSFYKNLAWYMFNDKYPREFRIAEFKAWQHPDVQAKENKTTQYSLLDNPTGISVEEGEKLVVMADLKGRKDVSIRVQNLDTPDADGFGGPEYSLVEGINILNMQTKGLIYVMYHPEDYETAPKVTLHFASGNVNGYFDSQNPAHEGRWNELLGAAKDKYFDVLGKYAHLTFPTIKFQNNTPDGKALIDWFDQLVYREQEFLGLEKYNRMFRNRMYFQVMYTSFMYSTSYRTCYNESTLDGMTKLELLEEENWGPAHEVGHSNQTRPGLKWLGTTEVTNNIMSLYIQTTITGNESRLETKENYKLAWNSIIVPGAPHATGADVTGGEAPFCKLVPFWQLELYYGKVLGRTPTQQADKGGFYPDVYEYVRTNEDLETAGEQQLEFVYNCCVNAKANLLDFFGKWGFLTPVDTEIDDYGKGRLTVTQQQIDNLKARVEGLGYAKPDVALEYITDYMVDSYKNKDNVVAGSASRSGNTITLANWQHVAAFEVKDASGKLVYVSEGIAPGSSSREFTLPTDWASGFTVYAVSAAGNRMPVNF